MRNPYQEIIILANSLIKLAKYVLTEVCESGKVFTL